MENALLKIFKNLEGDWILNRKIYDAVRDKVEYATGEATFRSDINLNMDGNILAYEELGILKLSKTKKSLKFKRSYIYKYLNEEIEIYLNDGLTKGTLFQKLLKREGEDQCSFVGTEHLCRLDRHNGGYYFKNAEEFETYFSIVGENKKIEIETSFKKKRI